jgi:hypothetical protein
LLSPTQTNIKNEKQEKMKLQEVITTEESIKTLEN